MTGFLTFSSKAVGTFSWELPERVQEAIKRVPEGIRQRAEEDIKNRVEMYLLALMVALDTNDGALTVRLVEDLRRRVVEHLDFAEELLGPFEP